MPLTDNKIKGLRPKEKLYRVADGAGLCIEVTPAGAKLWRYRYRVGGKASMLSIGKYPAVSLAEARKKRDEAAGMVARGINPVHHREAQAKNTFRAVADEYLEGKGRIWTPRTLAHRRALLELNVYPVIGDMPVNAIRPADILHMLRDIEGRAPAMAYLARQTVGAVFRLAVATLRADADPSAPLRGESLSPRAVQHHPIMTASEIPAFFAKLETYSGYPTTRAGALLLWLTTVRTVELLGAEWKEIDLDAGLWTVPAARMKMRRDHVVPLVPEAVDIFRSLLPLSRRSGLVFPGRDDPGKRASNGLLWKAWRAVSPGHSPHGVRGTFSTWAHDNGYPSEIIEAQLNHADRNVTRASYNRSAYLAQRREMLAAWASWLAGLGAAFS